MLLKDYTVQIVVPRCNPRARTINVIAELSDDISEAMPYLNAIIKGAAYQPEAHVLRFYEDGAAIDLHPTTITLTRIENEAKARHTLESLKELINAIYEKRGKIEPSFTARAELKAIDIYRHLPGTNCMNCGAPSCLAFAGRFVRREAKLEDCAPFRNEGQGERRDALLRLLKSANYL